MPGPMLLDALWTSLAFLSRLAPAREASPAQLAASMAAYPAAGLLIAGVAVLPVAGLQSHPWIAAWLWVAAMAWLTRGLHHDGLADVADAWGSGARGERFLEILKDSRLGAFGAMGLFLGMSAHLLLARELVAADAMGGLVFGVVWGRAACVLLAWLGRNHGRAGLAGVFLSALQPRHVVMAAISALAMGLVLVSPAALALSAALSLPPLFGLLRLAKANCGLGGDFLGTAILMTEIAAGLAVLLAG